MGTIANLELGLLMGSYKLHMMQLLRLCQMSFSGTPNSYTFVQTILYHIVIINNEFLGFTTNRTDSSFCVPWGLLETYQICVIDLS